MLDRDGVPVGALYHAQNQSQTYRLLRAVSHIAEQQDTRAAMTAMMRAAEFPGFKTGRLYIVYAVKCREDLVRVDGFPKDETLEPIRLEPGPAK